MANRKSDSIDNHIWKGLRRQWAGEYIKALIHAHGGEKGDVRWFAMRAAAFACALSDEMQKIEVKHESTERNAVADGTLPLFTGDEK